jgi:hypothetical protein
LAVFRRVAELAVVHAAVPAARPAWRKGNTGAKELRGVACGKTFANQKHWAGGRGGVRARVPWGVR